MKRITLREELAGSAWCDGTERHNGMRTAYGRHKALPIKGNLRPAGLRQPTSMTERQPSLQIIRSASPAPLATRRAPTPARSVSTALTARCPAPEPAAATRLGKRRLRLQAPRERHLKAPPTGPFGGMSRPRSQWRPSESHPPPSRRPAGRRPSGLPNPRFPGRRRRGTGQANDGPWYAR